MTVFIYLQTGIQNSGTYQICAGQLDEQLELRHPGHRPSQRSVEAVPLRQAEVQMVLVLHCQELTFAAKFEILTKDVF